MPTETPWTHSTVFICYYSIGATQTVRAIARTDSNTLLALYRMSSVIARAILNRSMFLLEITMIISHAALRHRCGR